MLTFGKLFGMGLVLRAIIGGLIIIASIFGFLIEVDNEMLLTHIINMRRNRVDIRPYCKRGTFDVPVGAEASISDTKKVEGIFIVGEDEAEMKKKKASMRASRFVFQRLRKIHYRLKKFTRTEL